MVRGQLVGVGGNWMEVDGEEKLIITTSGVSYVKYFVPYPRN